MDVTGPVVPRIELGIGLSIVQKELGGSFRVPVTEEVGVILLTAWVPIPIVVIEVIALAFEHVSDVVPVSLLPLPLFLCVQRSLGVLDLVYGLVVFGRSLCCEICLDLDLTWWDKMLQFCHF